MIAARIIPERSRTPEKPQDDRFSKGLVIPVSIIGVMPAECALKVVFKQLPANTTAEFDTILQRMMEVEASVDSCP